jgi:hypothetical protein
MALRLRRGTDAERGLITPLQGEIIYTTDTKKIYVGDGAAVGGILVGPFAATDFDVINDTTPQLGGDLDLNGNNIIGTGNINIDGTITATGNINLGDADADSITVAGLINSSLRPAIDDEFDLGSQSRNWKNIWATQVNVDTTLAVGSRILKLGGGAEDSASLLWDAESDTISAINVIAQNIQGNLVGSVFSDDSGTTLVDSINSVLSNGTLTLDGNTISVNLLDEIIIDTPNLSHYIYGVDNSPDNMAYLSIVGSRGTRAAPTTVQAGDLIGSLSITGFNGTSTETKVLITGGVDTVTGTNTLPGKLLFSMHDYDGNYSTFGSLNSRGTFEMPVFKATPFDDATARDNAINTPEPGMIVYLTSTNKLQAYNGTIWNDLF